MKNNTNAMKIQDLLPLLDRPSRYLGRETHRRIKPPEQVRLHMALAFPDLYEIGMSHFGIQILYHILNETPEILAERVFAPGEDLGGHLKAAELPLPTLETGTPLNRVDIIGFSLLYELNYTNVLYMLDLGKIPLLSKDRGVSDPFVIAGGPCTCNPEPVADIFDAMVVGEAEEVILKIARAWLAWHADGDGRRETLLRLWSGIEGVYVPSFYRPIYDAAGAQRLKDRMGHRPLPEKIVRRALVPRLTEAAFPSNPVMPFGKPVHDRLRIEIARGCTRGCRFCQAGILYRPVRERSPEALLRLTQNSLRSTGYDNVSLLSLSTGDYSALGYLMENLMDRCEKDRVAVSLPSIRADTLTPKLMRQIRRVRKTGFTIAPEAGSQRLRNLINKNLSDDEIVETVRTAFASGWRVVKLYFMVGLPFETETDLVALVELVQKLNRNAVSNRRRGSREGALHVSVATFIPKPHTPFQWAPQVSLDESREKIAYLKRRLGRTGIQFKWQNPEVSLLEGLWARGDRRLCRLLMRAYQKGCRFDGWTDRFRFDRWQEAVFETGIDMAFFTTRPRPLSEPLPWDPFDMRVTRQFLEEEWKKAENGIFTPDCRSGECQGCGVCDFNAIRPEIHEPPEIQGPLDTPRESPQPPPSSHVYRIDYAKRGPARFFGHLEMVKLILQGIRRAGIVMTYSRGFHPKPRVVFGNPLPVGVESEKETFDLWVNTAIPPRRLAAALKKHMPDGIYIRGCERVSPKAERPAQNRNRYRIVFPQGDLDPAVLESFQQAEKWNWEEIDRRGRLKTYELKRMVSSATRVAPNTLEVKVESQSGKSLRPDTWVRGVFHLPDETLKQLRILKLDEESDDV